MSLDVPTSLLTTTELARIAGFDRDIADDLDLALSEPPGDFEIGGILTVNGNSQLGNAGSDRVGIGRAPDSNHGVTFTTDAGNKIALYPISSTSAFGFGIQAGQLQYYVSDISAKHSFGYGDSDAFTEAAYINGAGKLYASGEVEIDGALNHDGTSVGFYGTSPIAKQTGVAVDTAAIHAALVALGLIAA